MFFFSTLSSCVHAFSSGSTHQHGLMDNDLTELLVITHAEWLGLKRSQPTWASHLACFHYKLLFHGRRNWQSLLDPTEMVIWRLFHDIGFFNVRILAEETQTTLKIGKTKHRTDFERHMSLNAFRSSDQASLSVTHYNTRIFLLTWR